jgi:hypothetical protein
MGSNSINAMGCEVLFIRKSPDGTTSPISCGTRRNKYRYLTGRLHIGCAGRAAYALILAFGKNNARIAFNLYTGKYLLNLFHNASVDSIIETSKKTGYRYTVVNTILYTKKLYPKQWEVTGGRK